jgi:hypothetical protein
MDAEELAAAEVWSADAVAKVRSLQMGALRDLVDGSAGAGWAGAIVAEARSEISRLSTVLTGVVRTAQMKWSVVKQLPKISAGPEPRFEPSRKSAAALLAREDFERFVCALGTTLRHAATDAFSADVVCERLRFDEARSRKYRGIRLGGSDRNLVRWRCAERTRGGPAAELSATILLGDVALLALCADLLLSRPSSVRSLGMETEVSLQAVVHVGAPARVHLRLADVVEVEAARRAWEVLLAEAEVAKCDHLLFPKKAVDMNPEEAFAYLGMEDNVSNTHLSRVRPGG